jgi:carboxyl-terminal processing protease
MNTRRQKFLLINFTLIALIIGIMSGAFLEQKTLLLEGSIPPNAVGEFGLMAQAWDTIQREYVDRKAIQPTQLAYGAVSGMVDALGDTGHSTFLTPEMVKEERNLTQGQFEGIGIEIQVKDGQIVIVSTIDGSPAQLSGLHAGEKILKVNGTPISGMALDQVVKLVLGPAGTRVSLTIQEPVNGQIRDVSIERARINIHNVSWQMLPGSSIAYIRLAGFSQGVTQDLEKALKEIRSEGGTKIILDLRNNPGGVLSEAVGVASQFLSKGNVLLEKNAQGDETPVPVKEGGLATDMPLIVLVNGNTASAAEIVSGAFQDAQRALLVGEKTFGTGTVLNQFSLSDGSALMLATQEWLTPNGRTIWHQGISPDVEISLPSNSTPYNPAAEKGLTEAQLAASGDTQLLKALNLLSGGNMNGNSGQNWN